jgi:hypothetical protein
VVFHGNIYLAAHTQGLALGSKCLDGLLLCDAHQLHHGAEVLLCRLFHAQRHGENLRLGEHGRHLGFRLLSENLA